MLLPVNATLPDARGTFYGDAGAVSTSDGMVAIARATCGPGVEEPLEDWTDPGVAPPLPLVRPPPDPASALPLPDPATLAVAAVDSVVVDEVRSPLVAHPAITSDPERSHPY